ncbi:MAG: WD40 repeat domain-containing protein [Gemmataceae bacterium]|nr:WD40 repeat domain-containing protein [Gemmataceae bacterium]
MHYPPLLRRGRLLALALVVGLCALAPAQEPASKRRPIPAKTARAAVEKLIEDFFGSEIAKATEPATRSALAGRLLQQARESRKNDDLAGTYVLYDRARDLAASAADHALAFQIVDELAGEFDLAGLDLKADTLAAVVKAQAKEGDFRVLTDLALTLLADAVDSDNYPAALRLGVVAEDAAKKAKSIPLVHSVHKRQAEVAELQKDFNRLQPDFDRLKKDPKDAEANLKLGEYFGLQKGKWERALPLLAQGSDKGLRAQARQDLARGKNAKDRLAIADGWWDLAERYKGSAQVNLLRRAAHWYEQAAQELTGLSRTKAVRRLDKVAALVQGSPVPVRVGPVGALRTLEGHTREVRGVAISPNDQYAASAGQDETVRLWNLATGKEERALKGHTKEVWAVAWHPNSQKVFSASWDGTVKEWDARTGNNLRTFTHPKDVNSVVLTRDGRWMLTGCDDHYVRLWDLATGKEVRRYGGHEDYVYGVAFSPDGKYVASGSADKTVRVWNRETGTKVCTITDVKAATNYVAFSADGRHVFGCGDSAAHMWDAASGKSVKRFEAGGSAGFALGMALSPDGRRLLTGHDGDRSVRLWDVASGKELGRLEGHGGRVICVGFSADGGRGISGGADGTVRLWGLPVR